MVIFICEMFQKIMDAVNGAGIYIAAFSIFLTVRYLLSPVIGVAMQSGSDKAAGAYANRGNGKFSPRNRASRYGSGKNGGRYERK